MICDRDKEMSRYLPSATSVLFSSSVRMTAVPEAAFFGWTDIREETEAIDPGLDADEHAPIPALGRAPPAAAAGVPIPIEKLLLLLLLLQEDGDEDVLETGDEDGEEGREAEDTDLGDSDDEEAVEHGEHEVEIAIELEPGSWGSLLMLLLLLGVMFEEQFALTTLLLEFVEGLVLLLFELLFELLVALVPDPWPLVPDLV